MRGVRGGIRVGGRLPWITRGNSSAQKLKGWDRGCAYATTLLWNEGLYFNRKLKWQDLFRMPEYDYRMRELQDSNETRGRNTKKHRKHRSLCTPWPAACHHAERRLCSLDENYWNRVLFGVGKK